MIKFNKPTTDQVIEILLITVLVIIVGSLIIKRANERQAVMMMFNDTIFRCESSEESRCGMHYYGCQASPTSIPQDFRCTINTPEKRDFED